MSDDDLAEFKRILAECKPAGTPQFNAGYAVATRNAIVAAEAIARQQKEEPDDVR